MTRSRDDLTAIVIFIVIAALFCLPLFANFAYWGQYDWDQFSFWNGAARKTILKYHQFPLWSPYASGGNVSLAHPHSLFLSPFFVLVLALGVVWGLKIEIIVHMVVGMFGMYRLSRHYRLNRFSSYVPPFVFMLSSIYPLHLSEGHVSWLPLALMPWAFLYYLKSEEKRYFAVGSAICLVLMSFAGSVDVLSISLVLLVAHAFWDTIHQRKLGPVMRLVCILVLSFLIGAVKLLPMAEFAMRNARVVPVSGGVGVPMLARMLFLVRQPLSPDALRELGQVEVERWHEYGAYVGILPLGLFVLGCGVQFRRQLPTLITALIIVLILMGDRSPVDLWKVLHSLPFYRALQVPSRYASALVLLISIFAGIGLSFLEGSLGRRKGDKLITLFVLLAILGDLAVTNGVIFKTTFRTAPLAVEENPVFRQRFRKTNLHGEDVSKSSMYPIFLENSGIIEGYEVVNVKKGSVYIEGEPQYRGEAYLLGEGICSITYFSPNKIMVEAQAEADDILVLNQNYHNGWRVKGSGKAGSHSGLISTRITAGSHRVIFYYLPGTFLIGLLVSGVTIVVMLSCSLQQRLREITHRMLRI